MLYQYLRGRLRQLGYENRDLCEVLNVNESNISCRMTGKTQWGIEEMYKVLDLCRDVPENLHLYFPRGGKSA